MTLWKTWTYYNHSLSQSFCDGQTLKVSTEILSVDKDLSLGIYYTFAEHTADPENDLFIEFKSEFSAMAVYNDYYFGITEE